MNLNIRFQDDHCRSFAEKIEGVALEVENSHPRVVQASLDKYNSTLKILGQEPGEANVRVYLDSDRFDVIRVIVKGSEEKKYNYQNSYKI